MNKALKKETDYIKEHPIVRDNRHFRKKDSGHHTMTELNDRGTPEVMLRDLYMEALIVKDHLNRNLREAFFKKLKDSGGNESSRYSERRRDERSSRDRYGGRYRGGRHDRDNDRDDDYGRNKSRSSRRGGDRYRYSD